MSLGVMVIEGKEILSKNIQRYLTGHSYEVQLA